METRRIFDRLVFEKSILIPAWMTVIEKKNRQFLNIYVFPLDAVTLDMTASMDYIAVIVVVLE